MTDENGKLIGPVQRFKPGTRNYYFYENGPVKSTRMAYLVKDPNSPPNINLYFYCAPDAQTGSFLPGDTYIFDLYPTAYLIK